MNLKSYLSKKSAEEREIFAKSVKSTVDYLLYQIGGGHRKASPQLARQIEKASGGKVQKHTLRPDIYEAAQ